MSRARRTAFATTVVGALVAAATGAAAQESITVSASAEVGSRQFYVEDLSGAELTSIALGSTGEGVPFQTRVQDSGFLSPSAGFSVDAEMTNLYRYTGTGESRSIDYDTRVASEKVSVAFPAVPTDVAGVSLGAVPRISVSGALPLCSDLAGLLPSDSPLLGSGSLLGGALGLLGLSDEAAPLCTALGGAPASTAVVAAPADAVLVTLQEQVLDGDALGSALPVALGTGQGGTFANPSYQGDGAGDPGKPTDPGYLPTSQALLGGSANSALDLKALVSPLVDGKPLFGTGGLTSVTDVVAALQGSVDTTVASVGNALAGLRPQDQLAVLSALAPVGDTPVASLLDTALTQISGNYRSFPRLKADLAGAPAGAYTGTMTVTFVQR